jgi:hypothetical protein
LSWRPAHAPTSRTRYGSPSFSSRPADPYTGSVRITITCYSYSFPPDPDPELAPGSYTPEPVYTLAGACADAGCTVDEDLYLNYRHLDRCELRVAIPGKVVLPTAPQGSTRRAAPARLATPQGFPLHRLILR